MKKPTKKQKTILIITGILVIGIVTTDLILVFTSLQNDGTGRGFSRYWRKEQANSFIDEKETSPSEELLRNSLELVDFEVEFLDSPQSVDTGFELLDLYEEHVEEINHKFKTGLVTNGRYLNEEGEEYSLEGYEVYLLFLNNGCNRLRILYSDAKEVQFVIGHDFSHPSCPNPTYSLAANIIPVEGQLDTIDLYDLTPGFNEVFSLEYFLEENLSDLGYRYDTFPLLHSASDEILFSYLDSLEGLVPVDSYGERVVYLNESDESFSFIFFNAEGFPTELEMNYGEVLFLEQDPFSPFFESIPITLQSGEVVEYKYSRWDPDTCIKNPIYGSTTQGLEVVGEAIGGGSIFINQDRDDPYLENIYRNHYLEQVRYIYNDIEEDDEIPYTYEQFVEAFPVIYWEAPFGKVLRFVRYDFITAPGDMGSCGYIT